MKIVHDHVEGPFRDGPQFFQKEVKSNGFAKGNVEHLQSLSGGFLERSTDTAVKAVLDRTCCVAGKSCVDGVGF